MKKSIVLGVDPGIANTGLAVVSGDGVRYKLLQCERIKSGSDLPTGERLAIIGKAIISLQKETQHRSGRGGKGVSQQKHLQ